MKRIKTITLQLFLLFACSANASAAVVWTEYMAINSNYIEGGADNTQHRIVLTMESSFHQCG